MRKHYPTIVVVCAGILTVAAIFGNVIARKGGILDDCLMDLKNPFYKSDQKVKAYAREGLKAGDEITVVIPFEKGLGKQDLRFIHKLTEDLKKRFQECGILSLSVAADYRDTGEEIHSDPFINENILKEIESNKQWNLEDWKNRVRQNPGVYGVLIGEKFDYAQIIIMSPVGYDEIGMRHRIAEFFEQRRIYWWEWFLKTDINPVEPYQEVTLAGWTIARGLMDAALLADVLKLSTIGIVIVAVAFYFSLLSLQQAVIASSVILVDFIWIRGTIGWLQALGFPIYERVYVLLVFTAIIVAGISFAERKFDAYNEIRAENNLLSRREAWRFSRVVNEKIIIVAIIAVLNFISLYQIGIRGIYEVGILSSIGIVYLLFLVIYFIPAVHLLIGRTEIVRSTSIGYRVGLLWNRILENIVAACYRSLVTYTPEKTSRRILSMVLVTFFGALCLIVSDGLIQRGDGEKFIEVKTKPLEYLPDTVVWRASELLNKKGNHGFGRLNFLVISKDLEKGIEDPDFIRQAIEYQISVEKIEGVRTAKSILDTLLVLGRETYQKQFPETSQQIHDILKTIEWDLGPLIKEQLWFDKGVVVFASMDADDSNALSRNAERIVSKALNYPDLLVYPFGKLNIYPQSDRYLREGQPKNVLSSFWIVIVVCALWVVYRNHRKSKGVQLYQLKGLRTGLVMSVPFIYASSFLVIFMAIARIPLDQATACIMALSVNAAIDFNLYLVADYQYALMQGKELSKALEFALVKKGKVIVIDMLLNCLCFLPLISSQFIPVARMGWIMMVMLLACGFGALVVMPAFLPWCTRSLFEPREKGLSKY